MLLLHPNKAGWALVPEGKCQTDLLLLVAAVFIVFNESLSVSCLGEFLKHLVSIILLCENTQGWICCKEKRFL